MGVAISCLKDLNLTDLLPVGVLVVDENFNILFWNKVLERWSGKERTNLIGKKLEDIYPEISNKNMKNRILEVINGGPPVLFSAHIHNYFLPFYDECGAPKTQITTVSEISITDSNKKLAIIVIQDVTEAKNQVNTLKLIKDKALEELTQRKKFEKELEKQISIANSAKLSLENASAAKSVFLANISHEFRTPLNAILGYSELISDEIESTNSYEDLDISSLKGDLSKIQMAGNNLLKLVNQLLEVVKTETGKSKISPEYFDINAMLDNLFNKISENETGGSNVLVKQINSGGNFFSDEEKVYLILINLLENALKYTQNGTITFCSRKISRKNEESFIEFTVEDTGIGMTFEQISNLNSPFFHVDPTSNISGVGMGLSLCEKYCQLLKGDMNIDSTINVGTKVTVIIPDLRNSFSNSLQNSEAS